MKLKNTTKRNRSLIANHVAGKGMPFRIVIPAEATLELTTKEYSKIKAEASELVKLGILKVTEEPKTILSKEEVIKVVKNETNVLLSKTDSLKELQEKASALGVDLSVAETKAEVAKAEVAKANLAEANLVATETKENETASKE